MRTDVAYEVVDYRDSETPLDRIGIVKPTQGGLHLYTTHQLPALLKWNDEDDEAFLDDEAAGRISILTDEGRIELILLGLENWSELEPFWETPVPDFQTDEEVNRYFYNRLWNF